MKKLILLPIVAVAFLVSCKSKSTTSATTDASTVVGTSPEFTGKTKLTAGMIAEGKTTFETSCAKCHDLPVPAKYSDEKWIGIMNAMAPKAKLSKAQSESVYNYVTFKN